MNVHKHCTPMRSIMIALRLCLLVSLWQAPIPWIHRHGTETEDVITKTGAEFRQHLTLWHGAIESDLDEDLGWHCHWILPMWGHALDEIPDDEPPSQEVLAFDQAMVSSTEDLSFRDAVTTISRFAHFELSLLSSVANYSDARSYGRADRYEVNSVLRC
jgi:hypothetical protein